MAETPDEDVQDTSSDPSEESSNPTLGNSDPHVEDSGLVAEPERTESADSTSEGMDDVLAAFDESRAILSDAETAALMAAMKPSDSQDPSTTFTAVARRIDFTALERQVRAHQEQLARTLSDLMIRHLGIACDVAIHTSAMDGIVRRTGDAAYGAQVKRSKLDRIADARTTPPLPSTAKSLNSSKSSLPAIVVIEREIGNLLLRKKLGLSVVAEEADASAESAAPTRTEPVERTPIELRILTSVASNLFRALTSTVDLPELGEILSVAPPKDRSAAPRRPSPLLAITIMAERLGDHAGTFTFYLDPTVFATRPPRASSVDLTPILRRTRIEVVARLGATTLDAGRVAELALGDVLCLDQSDQDPICIVVPDRDGESTIARGKPDSRRGHYVVDVTDVVRG